MKHLKLIIFTLALATSITSIAQLKTPKPSPTAEINQVVGLTEIDVVYSRPGMKDRAIFGELVPFDKVWRTGANKATQISFSTDVKLNGNDVKAGNYSLFTIPGAKEWTVIINSNTELWGAGKYKESEDVVRFKTSPAALKESMETFTIDFSHFDNGNANMNICWENTRVSIKIETAVTAMVEKQIKDILVDGPGAGTYFNAARFYLENDKNLNQALTWINAAIEKRPDAFWYIHQKAKIQAKMGDKKAAIATAQKSLEMAKAHEEGDYGYIANNENLIKELKSK